MIGGERDGRPTGDIVLVDARLDRTLRLSVSLATPRSGHTATVLPSGQVLVLGGVDASGRVVANAELVDPARATAVAVSLDVSARSEHTATLLTDGHVLIVGGVDSRANVVSDVEVIDSFTGRVEHFDARQEAARFGHYAALLPSAPVLIWGGLDRDNQPVVRAEIYEPATRRFAGIDRRTEGYLPDPDATGAAPVVTGVYPDPERAIAIDATLALRFSKPLDVATLTTQTFTLIGPGGHVPIRVVGAEGGLLAFVTSAVDLNPEARYTLFVNGAKDLAAQEMALVAIGFRTGEVSSGRQIDLLASERGSLSADVHSTADAAANLAGGAISASATAAMSRSVDAAVEMQPPGRGRLSKADFGLGDRHKRACGEDDNEAWIPDPEVVAREGWRSLREDSPIPRDLGCVAEHGITALTGQVLRMNGLPLAGATVTAGKQRTTTDEFGLFLLTGLAPGNHVLTVDGSPAGCEKAEYGTFEMKVRVEAGTTSAVPHSIWMPKLDSTRMVNIQSPTRHEVVLKHPKMPDLEIRIPAGTIIRDRAGKIVTRIGLTPMPIDRNPFPLPAFYDFRVYYTVQPAGATLEGSDGRPKQAEVVYPNYHGHDPGEKFLLWSYDPFEREWHVYGEGKVAKNGKTIEPDAGVGMYSFGGFSASPPNVDPPCKTACCTGGGPPSGKGNPPASGSSGNPFSPKAGDPVACGTGAFFHENVDLVVNDVNPIVLKRTHFSGDNTLREFGRGIITGLDYNIYTPVPGSLAQLHLVLPSGGRVILTCTSGCAAAATARFEAQNDPGPFFRATMAALGIDRWELKTLDGTVYTFWNWGGKLISIRDRFGNVTTYTRTPNGAGSLSRVTTHNGRWLEFTYSGSRITRAQDSGGRAWTYAYDNTGSTVMLSATDPVNKTWQYTWDFTPGIASIRDPRGNLMVQNTYTGGRVSRQTYADNTTMNFAYVVDGQGRITQTDVTDQRGVVRRLTFDGSGLVISNTFAWGRPEAQTWTATRAAGSNLVTSTTDPLGRRTDYTYDANGNVLTTTRLAGTANAVTTTYTYGTPFNLITSIRDPLNHLTSMTYDATGNLTRITDANNYQTNFTYTTEGQLKTVKNALNHTTTYTYLSGIVDSIKDPLNRTTKMFSDTAGRIVAVEDPLGNVTRTSYDGLDRVTEVSDPQSGIVRYEYDANSNLTAHVDQRGNRTEYTYDAMNRLTSRKDALLRTESYLYDVASKLSRFTDRQSQVSGFTYDALNRRTQAGFGATVGNPTAYTSTIGYGYDAGDRLLQANDSQNGAITRSYDGLDRLLSETTPTATVSYTYDAAGRRLTRAVPGQLAMSYVWDNANRLMSLTQGTQTVAFTYDNANRRTKITLPNGVDINYAYDNASQLTSITYKKGAVTLGDLIYTYDGAGRRTKITGRYARSNLPSAIATTSHNANNQLTNWGGPALSYDLNGNLTGDGTYTYLWNARNQLTQVKQGGTTIASYEYDAFGRRKQKVVNGITTRFVHDGQNFVQERDASNAVTANLSTGLGLDELYARTKGGVTSSYLMDHLGTIIAEADAVGTVQTSYNYEPYGKTTQTGAASDNSQRYTGREQDLPDLYHYRARYYSPRFDRFLSEDPIGIEDGVNLYVYVGDSPTTAIDPTGLAKGGRGGGYRPCTTRLCCKQRCWEAQVICVMVAVGCACAGGAPLGTTCAAAIMAVCTLQKGACDLDCDRQFP